MNDVKNIKEYMETLTYDQLRDYYNSLHKDIKKKLIVEYLQSKSKEVKDDRL